MTIEPYVNDDTGDLLRRARRYLDQCGKIPPPSARIDGDNPQLLIDLLACHVERQAKQIDILCAALRDVRVNVEEILR